MGDFDPRIRVHPSRSTWAVFIPWFVGLLASMAAAGMVLAAHYGLDLHLPVTGHQVLPAVAALAAVQYFVLLLPFSLVAIVRTAERVRMVEEHAGVTTDAQIRPAALVGWLIVPLIGGFVVMGRQQGDLNHIWDLARG
jgi:Mn2+/Fe2+ NRAMP family transporter